MAGSWLRRDGVPLAAYLAEKPLPRNPVWNAFTVMMNIVAPRPGIEVPPLPDTKTGAEIWWDRLYKSADDSSIRYGDRYRSSYVLIALLAFAALAMAALGGALPQDFEKPAGAIEILALICIALLLIGNLLHRWHERWISYRLLAELCRKQYVLSSIGRSLPSPK